MQLASHLKLDNLLTKETCLRRHGTCLNAHNVWTQVWNSSVTLGTFREDVSQRYLRRIHKKGCRYNAMMFNLRLRLWRKRMKSDCQLEYCVCSLGNMWLLYESRIHFYTVVILYKIPWQTLTVTQTTTKGLKSNRTKYPGDIYLTVNINHIFQQTTGSRLTNFITVLNNIELLRWWDYPIDIQVDYKTVMSFHFLQIILSN